MRYYWIKSKLRKFCQILLLFCVSFKGYTNEIKYSVEYDPNSPIKTIPLKDVTIKLELYQYSKPAGFSEVKTDVNQNFTLNQAYSVEVTSVQDQEKFKAMCSGYATESEAKVLITCNTHK